MWKFVSLAPATNKTKKWTATFADGSLRKKVSFGAAGYRDFTTIPDKEQAIAVRALYRARHGGDNLSIPTSPGALSWFLLWGDSQDMKTNLRAYMERFRL
jgi:hypothetical protein